MKVLSFGGGLNSSALLVEATKRGIALDAILFADTGAERPDTYSHIQLMSEWSIKQGQPKIETVAYKNREGQKVTLEERCLSQKMLPSLAYGFKKCSLRYKRGPQDKEMNQNAKAVGIWKEGGRVEKWLGIDADEAHRARIETDSKYRYRYPLVEWDLGREECKDIMKEAELPVPNKSSCFFCPAMKIQEIKQLGQCYPDLLERALQLEGNATLTSMKGLGRRFAWRELIEQEENQLKLFIPPNCDCYDG